MKTKMNGVLTQVEVLRLRSTSRFSYHIHHTICIRINMLQDDVSLGMNMLPREWFKCLPKLKCYDYEVIALILITINDYSTYHQVLASMASIAFCKDWWLLVVINKYFGFFTGNRTKKKCFNVRHSVLQPSHKSNFTNATAFIAPVFCYILGDISELI